VILLDTNIIADLLSNSGSAESDWSRRSYDLAERSDVLVCNHIVLAEVAAGSDLVDDLLDDLDRLHVDVLSLTTEAALAAGRAHSEYRRRGGKRDRVLPDFLIAGHAEALGAVLMTRDRRIARYFPDLTLITPETHP
jgi:predicted nucleic acid-binding protein